MSLKEEIENNAILGPFTEPPGNAEDLSQYDPGC